MNSRKRAQRTQRKDAQDICVAARSSGLEGSRFSILQLYRLAASGSQERLIDYATRRLGVKES